jgi:hypothetical protein
MSFHDWGIEGDTIPGAAIKKRVARAPQKVSLGCRAMFTIVGSGWWGEESCQLPVGRK